MNIYLEIIKYYNEILINNKGNEAPRADLKRNLQMGKKTTIFLILLTCIFLAMFINIVNTNEIELFSVFSIINILFFVITFYTIIISSKKVFKKLEPSPKNINLYARELPSKLKPAHVRIITNNGRIDTKTIYATILDLIDKKYIELKKEDEFSKYVDKKFIFKKTDKDEKDLLEYEKFLIEWLISKYGENKQVRNKDIQYKLNNNIYNEQPLDLFMQFQGLVMMSFPYKKFYKKNDISLKGLIYGITLIMGHFMGFLGLFLNDLLVSFTGAVMFGSSLITVLFTIPSCVLTAEGVEEKDIWLDLKKYLEDFSNINNKDIEKIKIWDFYLTYAVALGMANVLVEELNEFIGNGIYNKFETRVNNVDELRIIDSKYENISSEKLEAEIKKELEKY